MLGRSTRVGLGRNVTRHSRRVSLGDGVVARRPPRKKLKMGQYVKLPFDLGPNRVEALKNPSNRRVHEVLLTIAGAMGITDLNDFADPQFVQGPIAEILT